MKAKEVVRELLQKADIQINGNRPHDVHIHNEKTFQRWLTGAELGLGESYMDGWWDCDALDEFFNKLLLAKLDSEVKRDFKTAFHILVTRLFNRQTKTRSKKVARKHYDLGNKLFIKMLDSRMNYSCGYWKNARTLDEAQDAKLDLICKKLELKPGMKVLDIGCGWGGFARYAAEKYDVEVTGITISKEQAAYAKQITQGLPVTILLQDYRDVKGVYDAVLSIGFFEHVGYKNYRTYMEIVNRSLTDRGIALLHTIGNNVSVTYVNKWTDKYIFPNGMLPSVAQIARAAEGLFVIEDLHNFGPDYDKTLMAWYRNFEQAWPQLQPDYDNRFYRMWRYYLLSSAGGFRSRSSQLWQIVLTKPGREQPGQLRVM